MKQLNMINIIPVFQGREDFAVSEIRRQAKEMGQTTYALSLSCHPQGDVPSELIKKYCCSFTAIHEALKEDAVELGILVQSTMGHGWNGKVPLTSANWQNVVFDDGTPGARMCPLDPGFREYIINGIADLVRCNPAFLMIDDDYGLRANECFCPLHIARFNEMAGTSYSREEVQDIVMNRPSDDPLSKIFQEQRKSTAVDLALAIRRAVDKVNPEIRCGVCKPYYSHGFVNEVAHAFAGKTAPFVRVDNSVYGMKNPIDIALTNAQRTHQAKYLLEDIDDVIAEADTFPQNYYSTSATAFHAHITNILLNGLNGCKLWVSEFGNPTHSCTQQRYENQLRDNRKFYQTLLDTLDGAAWKGVQSPLFRPMRNSLHPTRGILELTPPDLAAHFCAPSGYPLHFATPDSDGIFAISGKVAEFLSDRELRTILGKNVLLDAGAAKLLSRRGFTELTGVAADDGDETFYCGYEQHMQSGERCGMMWEDALAHLTPLNDQVKIITGLYKGAVRDFQCEGEYVSPALTCYTNPAGGRVAIFAWDVSMPYYKIFRPQHIIWLREALDFLNNGVLEMQIPAEQQIVVRHAVLNDESELLGIINYAQDDLEETPVRLVRTPEKVEKLCSDGRWQTISFRRKNQEMLQLAEPLRFLRPLILRFYF
ncbi:MAG: hypothetical protein IKB16_02895 [Lentisphaeria bacterium]|nr:hypothetical protein [Lentisphaeria bacterium]